MKLESKISKVRLLEDRALVTRVFSTQMGPGQEVFKLEEISPILSDKTLTARVVSGEKISLTECRVVRRKRTQREKSSEEVQQLQDRLQELDDQFLLLDTKLRLIGVSINSTDKLLQDWLNEIAKDVHWERGGHKEWESELQQLTSVLQAHRAERLQLKAESEENREERERVNSQYVALNQPNDKMEAHLVLGFESESESETELFVEVQYVVPSACWRPCYLARWQGGQLYLESQACVWQKTGEDWDDVELEFSTQRAALGTSAPKLSRDVLRLQKKQKQVVVQSREESVIEKHVATQEVPGIDDGGEVLTLEAPAPANVLSDGRPYRIPLSKFATELEVKNVALAELAPCVFCTTRQKNQSGKPLLPGPVDLIKQSGLVGRTYLEHSSPGEEFQLSWGTCPEVSVHREHREGKEDSKMVSSWKTVDHTVKIHLRNQVEDEISFQVKERIPVSELKEVKVEQNLKKTGERLKADKNGFVVWSVELGAFEQKTLELRYKVLKKKKVVEA